MDRTSKAHWAGTLKDGQGTLSTPSGALENAPYSFLTRFENAKGTNPEELIGAAHAGCFTMALSGALTKAGHNPTSLDTSATVTLEQVNGIPTVTKVHLQLAGKVPGLDKAGFDAIAADAKQNCVISRLLNATITLETSFG